MQPIVLSESYLREAYNTRFLSTHEIAAESGFVHGTVRRKMDKYGIARRTSAQALAIRLGSSPDEVMANDPLVTLSNEAIEFIEGELLGDGHLAVSKERPNSNARYSHGSKYREYLTWLSKVMQGFGLRQSGKISERTEPGKAGYNYFTSRYPALTRLHKIWYPSGTKVIPLDLSLTPLKVRQWYIGDGSLSVKQGYIRLSTNSFTKQEVEHLIWLLIKAIGIAPSTNKVVNDYVIYIPRRDVVTFLEYIGPCPSEIECIYGYKWGLTTSHLVGNIGI